MNFHKALEQVKLTASEKKIVAEQHAYLKSCEAIFAYYATGGYGEPCPLDGVIGDAEQRFLENPTAEAAAEAANAAVLKANLNSARGPIGSLAGQVEGRALGVLVPIAHAAIARAVEVLNNQLAAGIAALEKLSGMESSIAELRQKHSKALAVAEFEKAEAVKRWNWIFANHLD